MHVVVDAKLIDHHLEVVSPSPVEHPELHMRAFELLRVLLLLFVDVSPAPIDVALDPI